MDKGMITLLIAVICLPLIIYVNYLRLKVFNSSDGERYMKRRMQGPYVPLSAEELAEDEARVNQLQPAHNRRSTDR
ncbi:MAG: hypothetical protein JWQ01_242 [Massilia sp.]|jgi:hypothetical protein|nr:hypothetical protein [Massilia sp.]